MTTDERLSQIDDAASVFAPFTGPFDRGSLEKTITAMGDAVAALL